MPVNTAVTKIVNEINERLNAIAEHVRQIGSGLSKLRRRHVPLTRG